jgi:hypothetical protein
VARNKDIRQYFHLFRCLWALINVFLLFYVSWVSKTTLSSQEILQTLVPTNIWLISAICGILIICIGIAFLIISAWKTTGKSWIFFHLFITLFCLVFTVRSFVFTCFGGMTPHQCPYQPEWFYSKIIDGCQTRCTIAVN